MVLPVCGGDGSTGEKHDDSMMRWRGMKETLLLVFVRWGSLLVRSEAVIRLRRFVVRILVLRSQVLFLNLA